MPDVEHTTTVSVAIDQVWAFVQDMDNWAPFLTGYQRHEKINRDESTWVVKGELGGLTRSAEFKVYVTEWCEPSRVTFTMQGLQEPVTGSGEFLAVPLTGDGEAAPTAPTPSAHPSQRNFAAALWERIARWLLRRVTKSADVRSSALAAAQHAGGGDGTRISFRLSLSAGGATGPVLNLLLAPMLKPVAEDLANNIAAAVEERQATMT